MREYACTEDRFLQDVSDHVMIVIRNDGIHRHLRFKRPESFTYWFDLITWPGALCIDGDMGTFVFRRIEDMFEFFRTDREYLERKGVQLAINPGYWSEKLTATAKHEGFKEFSSDLFVRNVTECFNDAKDELTCAEKSDRIWSEIEDQVLCYANDEHYARQALTEFCSEDGFKFVDTWEWDLSDYTFHFIWCCYAIAWGVKTYDEATSIEGAA